MPARGPGGILLRPSIYLGVDPGASGGLAWTWDGASTVCSMPETDRDIWYAIDTLGRSTDGRRYRIFALLEKVGGYVAGAAHPGSAMFKFGQSYGGLRMALTAAGIVWEEVTPQQWQRELSLSPRKKTEGKGAWKNRLKSKAQQLFPTVKVTLATADALLIAEVCRRRHERSKP